MTEFEKQIMGQRLKAALKFRSMTQRDLATKANLTTSSVCRFVNGERTPRTDAAIKICDALGVSLDWYVMGYCSRCKRLQDVLCENCKYLGEG